MGGKILVADDSEMIRNFHSYILKSAGFDVVTAVDGADALEKAYGSSAPWAVVITDINMPNLDGYALIERLRGEPEFEDIPIIIVSTEDELKDKQRGFEAGANAYLVKPTDPATLIEMIKMLIGA
ncbi:MAG TPA: response regulator [Syntrophothermus lipocalidus]|uniref:response regulator n=1 Tax=Syntrophothermus sp. TaxID=2736299 RepID=UPI0017B2EF2F|nr:response regulator [Syntrophothermus sp.]NSW83726.1 response regulator [Syntrophothermus sp.]HHV77289.1 response regulator [Syntrophothermus lipocalidus]HOV43320.1 response regulator [Syntrophothermus lipocalidus]